MIKLLALIFIVSCSTQKVVKTSAPVENLTEGPFITSSNEEWVKELVEVSNCAITSGGLRHEVIEKQSFEFTEDRGPVVEDKIGVPGEVTLWKPAWYNIYKHVVIAQADHGKINLNVLRNPKSVKTGIERTMPEMVATVCHEYGHILGYGHGDNGNHDSGVPNFLEVKCQSYAKSCLRNSSN